MNKTCKTYNRYKKAGFSLVEAIAALAIGAVLALAVIPNVVKPVSKSKDVKALEDVRQVVLAIEDYSISSGSEIKDSEKFSDIKNKVKKLNKKEKKEFLDLEAIKTIDDDMTYKTMRELINGKKNFTLQEGKIEVTK